VALVERAHGRDEAYALAARSSFVREPPHLVRAIDDLHAALLP
jgi:hypothetical protein